MNPPSDRPFVATPAPAPTVANLRALARVLDSAVGVPGTRMRVGADALIGLVPVVGDLAGAALSGYVVLSAARLGVPRAVLLRMVANVGVDALIGAVPLIGDFADVGWKANTRNVALLERALAEPAAVRRQSRLHVALVVLALVLVAAVGITATALVVRWLWGVATT